jgi:hypothetical protein
MKTKEKQTEKNFDAVGFMRKQRDKISKDIADMNFEEIKEYFRKKRKSVAHK